MADNIGPIATANVLLEIDIRNLGAQLKQVAPQLQTLAAGLGTGAGNQFTAGFQKGVTGGAGGGGGIGGVIASQFDNLGPKLQKVATAGKQAGMALTAAVTVPLVGAAAAILKFGGDFQSAMTQSMAIMGDLSDAMKRDLSDTAKQVARDTQFSATQAAEAFYFLASAGLTATESMQALPAVAKFAQAGMFDLAKATSLLANSQSALGLRIRDDAVANMKEMIRVSDVLVKANILADGSTEDFAEALTNKAGAALKVVNKDVEEGVAVLAAFADQGLKGMAAGEALNIVLRDTQTHAIKHKNAFKALGISVFDASGDMRNMADIVADLEKRLEGASDEQVRMTLRTLGFADRSVSSLLRLIGTSKRIKEYEDALRSAGGTTDMVAKKQLESFNVKLAQMGHRLELVAIKLFEVFEPIINKVLFPLFEKLVDAVDFVVAAFSKLPIEAQGVVVVISAIAAAAGPVLFVLSSLAGTVASVITAAVALGVTGATVGPVLAIIAVAAAELVLVLAGLAAVAYQVYKNWDYIKGPLKAVWEGMKSVALPVFEEIKKGVLDAWADISQGLKDFWSDISDDGAVIVDVLLQAWNKFGPGVMEVISDVVDVVRTGLGVMASIVANTFRIIGDVIQGGLSIISGVIQTIAGIITGDWAKFWGGLSKITLGVMQIVEGTVTGILRSIVDAISDFMGFWARQLKDLGALPGPIGAAARAISGAFESASKSTDKLSQSLSEADSRARAAAPAMAATGMGALKLSESTKQATKSTKDNTKANKDNAGGNKDLQATLDELAESKKKVKSVSEQMIGQVVREKEETLGLVSAIKYLEGTGENAAGKRIKTAIDEQVILEKLGKTILDVASDESQMGNALDPVILKYAVMYKNAQIAADELKAWREEYQKFLDSTLESYQQIKSLEMRRVELPEMYNPPEEKITTAHEIKIKGILNQVKAKREITELDKAVQDLSKSNMTAEQIERRLQISLADLERQAEDAGVTLSDLTLKMAQQARVATKVKDANRNLRETYRNITETDAAIQALASTGMRASDIEKALSINMDDFAKSAREAGIALSGTTKQVVKFAATERAIKGLGDAWGDAMSSFTKDASHLLIDSLFERTEKLVKNEKELNRLAGEFNIEKRRVNETVKQYYERVKEAAKGNEEFQEMFKNADAGESFFKKLGLMAKDTSKSMLTSLVDGFLKPFHSAVEGFGRRIGEELGSWVFGGGKNKEGGGLFSGLLSDLGGLFGGGDKNDATQQMPGQQKKPEGIVGTLASILGGGGFGGIFGGGDDRYTRMPLPGQGPVIDESGAFGGSGAGGFGGMFGQQATGLMGAMNPISAGVNIASTAIDIYNKTIGRIGAGRKAADEIVKSQNSFVSATLKSILDTSTLTASQKLRRVTDEWTAFQMVLDTFAEGGDKNPIVANQAFATVSPLVSQIINDLMAAGGTLDEAGSEESSKLFADAVKLFVNGVETFTGHEVAIVEALNATVQIPAAITAAPPEISPEAADFSDQLSAALGDLVMSSGFRAGTVYNEALVQPLIGGDDWFHGIQKTLDPIVAAADAGTLTDAMLMDAQQRFGEDVSKFHEIADSLADSVPGDMDNVQAGYETLNPILDAIQAALFLPAAEAAAVPMLAEGGLIESEGLVHAHEGEVVMPVKDIRAAFRAKLRRAMDAMFGGGKDRELIDKVGKGLGESITQLIRGTDEPKSQAGFEGMVNPVSNVISSMFNRPAAVPSEIASGANQTTNNVDPDITITINMGGFHITGGEMADPLFVRNKVLPEIMRSLRSGIGSARQEIASMVVNSVDGLTSKVVG